MSLSVNVRKMLDDKFDINDVMKEAFGKDEPFGKPFSCPFPDHPTKDDKTPSAVMYDETNVVHCFATGRVYGVADVLVAAGVDEQKIIGLVLDNSAPHVRKRAPKKNEMEHCRRLFQETAELKIKLMRKGKIGWQDCWPALDEYFRRVAEV